jgi:catechol 2,3-dioxygenase-like lactoylglutathione lyase family enzyme
VSARSVQVERVDFVAIPSREAERAKAFYGDTLGLRRDEHRDLEFWAGDTCLNIWEPERYGVPFQPQKNGHLAFRVPDVSEARKSSRRKASSSTARRRTPASVTSPSSRIPTGTT